MTYRKSALHVVLLQKIFLKIKANFFSESYDPIINKCRSFCDVTREFFSALM